MTCTRMSQHLTSTLIKTRQSRGSLWASACIAMWSGSMPSCAILILESPEHSLDQQTLHL